MNEKPIIMGRPVNLEAYDRLVNAKLGIDISDPYPGSVQMVCVDCGRDVWVGPRQQAAMQLRDDFIVCCPTHATVRAATADEGYDVTSLGNVHPREPRD
jgi:hypothetical protein